MNQFIIIVIIIIIIIIIINVALLLQDHLTMSLCRVKQREMILKQVSFQFPPK